MGAECRKAEQGNKSDLSWLPGSRRARDRETHTETEVEEDRDRDQQRQRVRERERQRDLGRETRKREEGPSDFSL